MTRRYSFFLYAVATLAVATAAAREVETREDVSEAKIRLLSDAVRARDAGDGELARAKLEELLKLAPGDATVTRLLASISQAAPKKIAVSGGVPDGSSEVDQLAAEATRKLQAAVAAARENLADARRLAAEDKFDMALERLSQARLSLPENPATRELLTELGEVAQEIAQKRAAHLAAVAANTARPAKTEVEAVAAVPAPSLESSNPAAPVSGASVTNAEIAALITRGRRQYVAGDPMAAAQTFARVLELSPGNGEADKFLRRIATESVDGNAARTQTSAQLINEVQRAWQRPAVHQESPSGTAEVGEASPLLAKLNDIVLPEVNFSGLELGRAITTLSAVSVEFDATGRGPKGVNIILLDPSGATPIVNHISLRNLSLKRVLDFVTQSVGYQYQVQADAVIVRPGGEQSALETQFFPVSRSTVLRMTGRGAEAQPAAPNGSVSVGGQKSVENEGQEIRGFLQLAGVGFEGVTGSTLAFDGSQLIVTQTARNLERIRAILARYSDVRQVEIEAKFMEVQDGALEELGINWRIGKKATQLSGASVTNYATNNRTLDEAFKNATTSQQIRISDQDPISVSAPSIPGGVNLGANASPLAAITGILGEFNVNAVIRALAQRSGTELLSAPKLTVLSGNQATITVAQELRYPESYGQVQSQVGTGSASGGGSAGVAITAGTPQQFTSRNVGVELKVTPVVEEDDYSISLDLNPKVTEFEGFVEYGGTSVAISQGTTVTVPSGFYQPIFAVREVNTKVTIWDGATLVMGGLTREDARKTNDKVPVVGNLPVLGRLFRSSGESAQKRNLLIFVTANLVSPGGSLKKQAVRGASAGAIYQHPTIVTPGGAAGREAKK